MNASDLRITAHIKLETGSGETIAEIKVDDLLHSLLDTEAGTAEGIVRRTVATRIVSPIRCLVRGYILQKEESTTGATRLDKPQQDLQWPDDPENKELEDMAVAFHRDRMLEDAA